MMNNVAFTCAKTSICHSIKRCSLAGVEKMEISCGC